MGSSGGVCWWGAFVVTIGLVHSQPSRYQSISIYFTFSSATVCWIYSWNFSLIKPSVQRYKWATLFLGDVNTETWPPGWGSLRWESKVWLRVLRDSDHWVIALQTADLASRQRESPTETRPQLSDSNLPTGSNIWSQVPEWAQHRDILTDYQS
jgi:hypothetical protein